MDEIYEDELEPVKPAQPETIQTATSEAHELSEKRLQQLRRMCTGKAGRICTDETGCR